MRVRIARDELRRIRELSQTINAPEREIAALVAQVAPQLLCEPGFGPLTAAKLVGEIAGADRFASDAKLARAAGVAPIPVDRPFAPPATPEHPIAYFCAEFGVHRSLPVYSGGLGALAGDILKEASDRALPLVAVGLMYRQGYFRQRMTRAAGSTSTGSTPIRSGSRPRS